MDRDDIQAEVRSCRKVPDRTISPKSRLVAAITRTSTRKSWFPPTRVTVRSCKTRSSFGLDALGEFADLIEKNRAAARLLELAALLRNGAGKRPFLMPEELTFEQRFASTPRS